MNIKENACRTIAAVASLNVSLIAAFAETPVENLNDEVPQELINLMLHLETLADQVAQGVAKANEVSHA